MLALGLPGLHAEVEIERVAVVVDPLVSSYCEALGAALGEAGRGGGAAPARESYCGGARNPTPLNTKL